MTGRRYAVVPTTGRDDLWDCLDAIQGQVDRVIVLANRCSAPTYARLEDAHWVEVMTYLADPPNISVMWNMGLIAAERHADGMAFDVAVLNDDAIVPEQWFSDLVAEMRLASTVAASRDQTGALWGPLTFTEAGPIDLRHRMAGFAFVLDGAARLRLDEQFRWWYGDDDLEWRARQEGGVSLVHGAPVEHRHPSASTIGRLAEIAGEDRERFIKKWGKAPH